MIIFETIMSLEEVEPWHIQGIYDNFDCLVDEFSGDGQFVEGNGKDTAEKLASSLLQIGILRKGF